MYVNIFSALPAILKVSVEHQIRLSASGITQRWSTILKQRMALNATSDSDLCQPMKHRKQACCQNRIKEMFGIGLC